jgi:urea carboxylase
MIQFDAKVITQRELLQTVQDLESSIEATTDIKIPCREIHLPVVFDHPDNVEYLRTNNALSTRRETFETLLKSPYLIVAVGFLVGTPILFPLEPKSGIAGQKYNPTRVSTPGGTIGMGGSLFAIYPVEAPGGYMMFARTMECWDTFGTGPSFTPTRPWLYEPFDIIHYHEVSVAEYDNLMLDYRRGNYSFDIRDGVFHLAESHAVFANAQRDPALLAFRSKQKAAIKQNLEIEKKLFSEWSASKQAEEEKEKERVKHMIGDESKITIDSPIDANVWKVLVKDGDVLEEGQTVAILEAMKMEISVLCEGERAGMRVEAVVAREGMVVCPGEWILVLKA